MPHLPTEQLSTHSISFGTTRTVILDTDYLLNQVKEGVRNGGSLFLRGGQPLGNVRAFASSHVLDELYQRDQLGHRHKWDKLSQQSTVEGWPRAPEAFRTFFVRHFLSAITFVDVTGMFEDELVVQNVRAIDPKDARTAQLAVLLSRMRPIVYTHDRSLWKPGLAPQPMQFQAVLAAGHDLESGETAVRGVTYVGAAIVWGVDGVTNRTATLFKVPRWVPYLALAGAATWYLIGKERRDKVFEALKPVGDFLTLEMKLASHSIEVLTAAVANVPEDDHLECRVAEVLARCGDDERLLAREIQDRASKHSPSLAVPTIPEIRAVLSNPSFVQGPRYRYRLGRTYSADNG